MHYNIKLLFVVCIAVRLALAYLVYLYYNHPLRLLLSLLYGTLSLGMFYQFIRNNRKQGAFGQKIWWANYRPIHGLLWGTASWGLYNKYENTYIILILDTLIGVGGHIYNRYL